ncbi:hypothetical protein ASPCADRAFT_510726 [Aspergillus carbonarius ITEM 5010]|uniref:Uncharacterized protein n=1 Tax=Aspergillus carbonarius (strain ITEM 5010) TaxID=602072 RepID=A0A1R3R8B8_ASPC5|nr:hypothetical protein ASPCADRAFT_510726 [Aspergillus carbonarius ITEM 5010]
MYETPFCPLTDGADFIVAFTACSAKDTRTELQTKQVSSPFSPPRMCPWLCIRRRMPPNGPRRSLSIPMDKRTLGAQLTTVLSSQGTNAVFKVDNREITGLALHGDDSVQV